MEALPIISCIVGFCSLVVAIVVVVRNSSKDKRNEDKDNVQIHADLQSQINVQNSTTMMSLNNIDSGIRDLRADNRGLRADLTKLRDDLRDEMKEIHNEAMHATELAEAAHRRLDRLGAEPDNATKK